jgi:alkanesulfonate monooxygenase SsuD/methylene tetrahydromethanopterin reductase-like flavin-dependent oxidoreductase (luciferase family)
MRFGVLINGGHLPTADRRGVLEGNLEKVRLARDLGYDAIWVGHGYLMNIWHPTVLLARIAAEAPEMDLGMVGLMSFQQPVEMAEQLSTLDVIANGRFTLAAALGWRDFHFRAFDVPKAERLGRFLEVMEAMKLLWTRDRVTYHGRYVHLDDVPGAGKPVQRPTPRIVIAANLDAGVRRAARVSDGWLISSRSTLPTITRQAALYRQACAEHGTRPWIGAWRETFVGESVSSVMDAIRPSVERLYADRAKLGHSNELPPDDRIDRPFEELLEGRFIYGDPARAIDEIARYRELGVELIVMRMQWPGMPGEVSRRALRTFGEKVLPKVK